MKTAKKTTTTLISIIETTPISKDRGVVLFEMEREKDLTFLVHKLLNQQRRLRQLYNELKMEEHSEYNHTSANESETERY